MTDTDTAVARLEEVLDRLERLGLIPPVPGQTAAVNPDGTPANVVAGELIESAWGNAVVDTIGALWACPVVADAYSGTISTNASSRFIVPTGYLPEAVIVTDATPGAHLLFKIIGPLNATNVEVSVGRVDGSGVPSTIIAVSYVIFAAAGTFT